MRGGDGIVRIVSVPMWLVNLLNVRPFRGNVGPEDTICIDFANRLRAWALDGSLRGTWTKIPHEVGGVPKYNPDGRIAIGFKIAQTRYAKQIAMGMITGSADYVFTTKDGAAWIEMKSKTGSMTDEQKAFRQWCEREEVTHGVAKSADEAEELLRQWNILR